jgi:hypothetical protein
MNSPDSRRRGTSLGVAPATGGTARDEAALERIGAALAGLRYGSVLAIVQDGVVIQIDRTEKTRLDKHPEQRREGT